MASTEDVDISDTSEHWCLPALEIADFTDNRLEKVSAQWFMLSQLRELRLARNNIHSNFFLSLYSLHPLQSINLYSNTQTRTRTHLLICFPSFQSTACPRVAEIRDTRHCAKSNSDFTIRIRFVFLVYCLYAFCVGSNYLLVEGSWFLFWSNRRYSNRIKGVCLNVRLLFRWKCAK